MVNYPEREADEAFLNECVQRVAGATDYQVLQIRTAARFAWMRKEMGGQEYVDFAHKHNTPIVPPNHPGHPLNLIKNGWKPKSENGADIRISRWPDGTHFYATVNGEDVQDENGNVKWDTYELAQENAIKYTIKLKL